VKIDFEGVTRVLDLQQNITLKQSIAIQEYTGMAVYAWQERVAGVSALDNAGTGSILADAAAKGDSAALVAALRKAPMYADPAWIITLAAAHWLMLAQAGENPPPLDDDYDCEVLGFHLALLTALSEEAKAKAKAKKVPDKPDPTARPVRPARSSRRTAAPKKPIPITDLQLSAPLPRLTGS
jgi:hypothetical protein